MTTWNRRAGARRFRWSHRGSSRGAYEVGATWIRPTESSGFSPEEIEDAHRLAADWVGGEATSWLDYSHGADGAFRELHGIITGS